MLKLKFQYFGHLMRSVDSLEKTLILGGIGGRRRRGRQRMRWLDGITDSMGWVSVNSGSWWWTGRPGMLRFMGSQRVGHDWATELNWNSSCYICIFWRLSPVYCIICKYFLLFCRLSFFFYNGSFAVQKLLTLIRSLLFIFVFIYFALGHWPKKT